jgi:hypothetical protein
MGFTSEYFVRRSRIFHSLFATFFCFYLLSRKKTGRGRLSSSLLGWKNFLRPASSHASTMPISAKFFVRLHSSDSAAGLKGKVQDFRDFCPP